MVFIACDFLQVQTSLKYVVLVGCSLQSPVLEHVHLPCHSRRTKCLLMPVTDCRCASCANACR